MRRMSTPAQLHGSDAEARFFYSDGQNQPVGPLPLPSSPYWFITDELCREMEGPIFAPVFTFPSPLQFRPLAVGLQGDLVSSPFP